MKPNRVKPSGVGCNSVGIVPVGTGVVNVLFVVVPLAIIGDVR